MRECWNEDNKRLERLAFNGVGVQVPLRAPNTRMVEQKTQKPQELPLKGVGVQVPLRVPINITWVASTTG